MPKETTAVRATGSFGKESSDLRSFAIARRSTEEITPQPAPTSLKAQTRATVLYATARSRSEVPRRCTGGIPGLRRIPKKASQNPERDRRTSRYGRREPRVIVRVSCCSLNRVIQTSGNQNVEREEVISILVRSGGDPQFFPSHGVDRTRKERESATRERAQRERAEREGDGGENLSFARVGNLRLQGKS